MSIMRRLLNDTASNVNVTNGTTTCGGATNAASADFWIGVIASLLGSVILNLGLNIQKLAFVRNSRIAPELRKPVYKNCLWILGFVVFAIGNGGDAVGLTFTAQSIITPIGAIALVSNLVFARLLIGEEIGCKTSVAIVFIIAGVVAIVVSGNTNCSSVTLDTLKEKFVQPAFLVFALFHMSTLIGLLVYTCSKEQKMREVDPVSKKTIDVGLQNLSESEKIRLRLAIPMLASCFAAWTVLLSKSVGELVKQSARSGESEFARWETYFILTGFLFSMPCQVMYINKGLAYFESMYIIPIFYSTWLIGSILMGALFWNEFAEFGASQFGFFSAGVVCVMIGVVLLQQREIQIEEFDVEVTNEAVHRNSTTSATSSSEGRPVTRRPVASRAVDHVLERRNTFFTRAAAAVVSAPAVQRTRATSSQRGDSERGSERGSSISKPPLDDPPHFTHITPQALEVEIDTVVF